MQSKATTVKEYLGSLPADRRAAIEAVRAVILKNLDRDFEEGMQYGMIGYYVPHRIFPDGYHCDPRQPLPFAGLASQKNHMSVYLMSTYGNGAEETWLRKSWEKAGKKLDMGKCCIRFKKLDDVPLDVLGEAFRRVTAEKYVEHYRKNLLMSNQRAAGKPAARTKAAQPKTAAKKKASGGPAASKSRARAKR